MPALKDNIYITKAGSLKRMDNNLIFDSDTKTSLPIENIKAIFIFSEVNFNKRVLEFLTKHKIIMHFFNYYGYYIGSYYPRDYIGSGEVLLKQAESYLNYEHRLDIAKKFVLAATLNSLKNLKYYQKSDRKLDIYIKAIENLKDTIKFQPNIEKLMNTEGKIRELYYKSFNNIIKHADFYFEKRSKKPPKDPINVLISFTNSMVYVYVLSAIYHSQLDARIGFLHSTNSRKFSLNLDIAEIFKPIIGDRTIFKAINKNMLDKSYFQFDQDQCFLNEKGREKMLLLLEDKLKNITQTENKNTSYEYLLKEECYKLQKHLLGKEEYKPFVSRW
ncbi:MAG: type I-B CRISPR-associated endonuclease Cas1b [Desulfurella sp.]